MHEENKCPNCNSDKLMFGRADLPEMNNEIYFPVECSDCGHTFRQVYKIQFVKFTESSPDDEITNYVLEESIDEFLVKNNFCG